MFMDREAAIHFIGGAVGGTAGTAITCPLEVVKTRMQSKRGLDTQSGPSTSSGSSSSTKSSSSSSSTKSNGFFKSVVSQKNSFGSNFRGGQFALERIINGGGFAAFSSRANIFNQFTNPTATSLVQYCVRNLSTSATPPPPRRGTIVFRYIGQVIKTEGIGALYKGLIPNLIGVAPSKAVYFYTYSTSKRFWNDSEVLIPNSAIVHMVSAGCAGFVAASAVNPIWLVKTRLQLHQGHIGIWQMIKRIHKREGFKGFYKGVTASYAGVSETMIQFCIYEYFRGLLLTEANEMDKRKMDFLNFMVAGGSAKFIACVVAYPHEVVRTRLREETGEARGFFKTLYQLYKEGHKSMYRGLSVQLMRTVPNTAITMGTYEFVVYMLHHL
ncbi:Protein CBG02742 [Caenorhabditis briggsae]|uniref:Protein CBG02742 n=2 Tax=Caenorhabditis briggsae TaxID=6238 RepID=A8WTL8_CAEBR|nr:Protein CBG02742 [Caenorhabditis briggsae]ULU06409.1 hypothetical protein L3Y34_018335 [Caenorhabditis briggsae]CAP23830.1 Protein CBG02742 [Caenorhabditis briggsae]